MFKKFTVKNMTVTALFIALSVVLARFCVIWITPNLRISFGNIPIMMTGLMFGPIIGGLAGGIADIVGSVFLSGMGWYPPITLSAVIIGAIPGLLAFIPKKKSSLLRVGTTVLAANVCGSMLWTTYCLAKLSNVTFWSLGAARIPLYLGMTVLETIIITALYKALRKVI